MNRPDVDELAALWHADPDPLEQAQIEAAARRARRRGRLLGYVDYAWAVLLLVITVGGSFMSTSPLTIAMAVPLMIAIAWLTWKRRQMRQMARTLNTTTPEAFIESSLRNARTNLRRVTISLALLPLLVPIALAFKVSLRTGGGPQEVWEAFLLWTQTVRAPITVAVLSIMGAFSLRSRRKIRAEIQHLENLRRGYAAEAESEK